MVKKIYLASDHAGFKLKEHVKKILDKREIEYEDIGPKEYDPDDDYPDFIIPAVEKAVKNKSKAIVLGYTGQGEAIAANKVNGARAVVYYGKNSKIPLLGRQHNDSNVLSLGAAFLSKRETKIAVLSWLQEKFEKG
ncbi:MAG: RpiB/LacA/LacB family sugar-phosphate isomerase, partial [Candidatus Nanoarchaeia archaeon]